MTTPAQLAVFAAMAKKDPRKPLNVAERKAQEAGKAGGDPVDLAYPIAREKAKRRQRWETIGMAGTVLQ